MRRTPVEIVYAGRDGEVLKEAYRLLARFFAQRLEPQTGEEGESS
ncbi:MAG: hypothetical protein ACPLPT_08320 [Moorellales bacterium]